MNRVISSVILVLTIQFAFGQNLVEKISEIEFSIGKTIEIKSQLLNETRELNIYLPLSYSQDSLKFYPVIYLLDGSKDEDFIHITGIIQFGTFSWVNIIPESIVIGIGNVDRKRDFTYPSQYELDQKEFPTSGQSKKFIDFMEKELQPFIDSTYRTTETKTIIGQSLGGLLVTEVLLKKPELFNNYIIVSPSLWWDKERLLDFQSASNNSNKSIYIAVGKEGEVMERTAKELYDKLRKEQKSNTKIFYNLLEDKTHGDALHIAVYDAFEKIFKSNKE